MIVKSLDNVKISIKLPVMFVAAALVASIAVGVTSFMSGSKAVHHAEENMLAALAQSRKNALETYLSSIEQDMRFIATNPTTMRAVEQFSTAWSFVDGDKTAELQRLYIEENPNPTGQKETLDFAPDGSLYSAMHKTYHPWFRQFLRERGYYDIFLFDLEGNLVYTVFKELDYATNLNTGEWKDSDLGNAFSAGAAGSSGSLYFFDFKAYAPSHGAPASFISTPIVDEETGEKRGVLVFQMPVDQLNAVMNKAAGLGETGETLLVGSDGYLRTNTRFEDGTTILKLNVSSEAVDRAIAGEAGFAMVPDAHGVDALTYFLPVAFNGTTWALLAEISTTEINAPVVALRNQSLILAGAITVLIGVIGLMFARGIARPISLITEAMREQASGNFDAEIPGVGRGDELGQMADAVEVFKEAARERRRLNEEQQKRREAEDQRTRCIEELINVFDGKARGSLSSVSAAAEQMK
jgi:methyl-accepting chemotaxis protein